jgi:hypothetical protein
VVEQRHLLRRGCQAQHHLQLGGQVSHKDLGPPAVDERLMNTVMKARGWTGRQGGRVNRQRCV